MHLKVGHCTIVAAHLHWEWGRDYTEARSYFIQYTLRIWKEKIQTCEI
jgi:hypothetical protein